MSEIHLFNTLAREKQAFTPLDDKNVRMYVCGPTVYDYCHLGHARAYTAFDVVFRFLRHRYGERSVNYVRNITDIDDKIIARAKKEIPHYDKDPKAACLELTEKYTKTFHEDMEALNLLRPLEIKATESLDEIIQLIRKLIEKGHAYEMSGNVYFQVNSFKEYGKLSKRPMDELENISRIDKDANKKASADFALWKKHQPGEPAWESPWGPGRPGWHIECSAMSMKALGETFDIHGGGQDLVFPHHENEICQSEACTGKTFARYWLHNGFITLQHEKMSKSLGNFKTVRDLLTIYRPMALKLYLLSTHYRSPLDFNDHLIQGAEDGLKRIENALAQANTFLQKHGDAFHNFSVREFDDALKDDFNTPQAMGVLFSEVTSLNNHIVSPKPSQELVGMSYGRIQWMLELLGIVPNVPQIHCVLQQDWREEKGALALMDQTPVLLSEGQISRLVASRAFSKNQKDFALADAIRKFLSAQNIEIRDGREAHLWIRKK